jgi:hypothetical protein
VLAVERPTGQTTFVTVLPITHSPPANSAGAVEIPAADKRHLKLDDGRSFFRSQKVCRQLSPNPRNRINYARIHDDRMSGAHDPIAAFPLPPEARGPETTVPTVSGSSTIGATELIRCRRIGHSDNAFKQTRL